MLNALRHQWFGSLLERLENRFPFKCSTPCGISGLAEPLQPTAGKGFGSAQRLAASVVWQKCQQRRRSDADGAQRLAASVVLADNRHPYRLVIFLCAQRLAASVVWQATVGGAVIR